MDVKQLPGIGEQSAHWLQQVGITTEAELRTLGAVEAYLRLQNHPEINPSLNFLYALVGALDGRHWAEVARTDRDRLVFELEDRQQLGELFKADSDSQES